MTRRTKKSIWLWGVVLMVAGWCGLGFAESDARPRKGSQLPRLVLNAPASPQACAYLDVAASQPFTLSDVDADLILLEIIGIYCPQCHQQRPHINRLYHRVQKTPDLAKKIKFLGIAAGAYVAIRHRANEAPVDSYEASERRGVARNLPAEPQTQSR